MVARLRVDGDAQRCSGEFRARGRLRRGAARRGERDGVDSIDGGASYSEGVEVAAEGAGELRVTAVLLHKNESEKGLGVRHVAENEEEEVRGAGVVEVHRNAGNTAADARTPARNPSSLGARERGEKRGNGRGRRGQFIGQGKEGALIA